MKAARVEKHRARTNALEIVRHRVIIERGVLWQDFSQQSPQFGNVPLPIAQLVEQTPFGFFRRRRKNAIEGAVRRDNAQIVVQNDERIARGRDDALGVLARFLHSALRGAFGGLIAKDQHHANDLAARIVNRCAGVSDGDFASIAREEQGVVRQSDDDAFAQHARHGVLHRRARLFVDDAEHLGERFAARFGFAPAGQLFGNWIHSRHASLSICGDDRIADAVECGAQFRLALDERGV